MSKSKTELSGNKGRRFGLEFQQDAVRLVVSEGYSFAAAAKAVGISDQTLRKWHTRLVPPVECGEDATVSAGPSQWIQAQAAQDAHRALEPARAAGPRRGVLS